MNNDKRQQSIELQGAIKNAIALLPENAPMEQVAEKAEELFMLLQELKEESGYKEVLVAKQCSVCDKNEKVPKSRADKVYGAWKCWDCYTNNKEKEEQEPLDDNKSPF